MGVCQCALLRDCGLVAFLETAAVWNAAKNPRDKLRVIRIAETEEYLILVVKLTSIRVSNAFRFSLTFGEVVKLEELPTLSGRIEIQHAKGISIYDLPRPAGQIVQAASGQP